ncbi:MAG: hypothetical protein AABW88_03675 [Nanoarchaeota archaeon]
MSQNRNKLIDLFIGNIAMAIVHEILKEAIDDENLRGYYDKEFQNSFSVAEKYRNLINPANRPLPEEDTADIKDSIMKKVRAELLLRTSKGYKNINMSLIEEFTDETLEKMNVIKKR